MADLATLFHNPESLSDSDLGKIRRKLAFQRWSPLVPCLGAFFWANSRFARHPYHLSITVSCSVLSYFVGVRYLSYLSLSG